MAYAGEGKEKGKGKRKGVEQDEANKTRQTTDTGAPVCTSAADVVVCVLSRNLGLAAHVNCRATRNEQARQSRAPNAGGASQEH